MKKPKALAVLNIKGIPYSIRTTVHSEERIRERKISTENITDSIQALSTKQIRALQNTKDKAIIINEKQKTSIVIGFIKNKIKVITVIGTEEIRNVRGTQIIRL